jgi:hypothetical protein
MNRIGHLTTAQRAEMRAEIVSMSPVARAVWVGQIPNIFDAQIDTNHIVNSAIAMADDVLFILQDFPKIVETISENPRPVWNKGWLVFCMKLDGKYSEIIEKYLE